MNTQSPLRILLVPDSIHWVTGTTATEIANRVPGIEPIICSYPVLLELLNSCKEEFPFRVDIAHFLTPHIATNLIPKFFKNAACIATVHHVENSLSTEPVENADAVMTVCQQWHDYLIDNGADPNRLVLIRNGVDTGLYRPPSQEQRNQLREQYGIPDNAFVVGFSAKKSSDSCGRKGIEILEEIIDKSVANHPSFWWVIRGPGWQEIVQKYKDKTSRIIHLPFLLEKEEVAESYYLMDAYLVTARIEGGPVPLIEAMSTGLSCITTPVGLAPEIIHDGINGYLNAFDDVAGFINRLTFLEKDPETRGKIGTAARTSIVEHLKWENTVTQVPTLYRKALLNSQTRKELTEEEKIFLEQSWTKDTLEEWIRQRETLALIRLLKTEGDIKISRRIADKAFLANNLKPFDDFNLWLEYGYESSIPFLFKVIRKLKNITS